MNKYMSRAADFLQTFFISKKQANNKYSLRTFASELGVNAGRITQYFSSERLITKSSAQSIAKKLQLDASQTAYFIYLCEVDKKNKKLGVGSYERLLADDEIAALVEWHHFAILSLMSTHDFKSDVKWIAHRLALPLEVVQNSIDRLVRLNLIQVQNGILTKMRSNLTTTNDIPNEFLQLSHKEELRFVIENMANIPVTKRDVSSITFAFNDRYLSQAKEQIKLFRRKMATLSTKGKKNSVYSLCIQMIPLTKEQ